MATHTIHETFSTAKMIGPGIKGWQAVNSDKYIHILIHSEPNIYIYIYYMFTFHMHPRGNGVPAASRHGMLAKRLMGDCHAGGRRLATLA